MFTCTRARHCNGMKFSPTLKHPGGALSVVRAQCNYLGVRPW